MSWNRCLPHLRKWENYNFTLKTQSFGKSMAEKSCPRSLPVIPELRHNSSLCWDMGCVFRLHQTSDEPLTLQQVFLLFANRSWYHQQHRHENNTAHGMCPPALPKLSQGETQNLFKKFIRALSPGKDRGRS